MYAFIFNFIYNQSYMDQNKVFLLKRYADKLIKTVNPVVFKPLLICCCFCAGLDDSEGHSAHLKNPPHIITEVFND